MLIERIKVLELVRTAEASRPDRTCDAVDKNLAEQLATLRRAGMSIRRIATGAGRIGAIASGFLAGIGLAGLQALEWEAPA